MAEVGLRLELVEDMPEQFAPGVFYVSEEYEIACHRCACGCGNLVYTPLGPTEWSFRSERGKPSLRPSIGNWSLPCRSHYWIKGGRIIWARNWSDDEVDAGRLAERRRRGRHVHSGRYNNPRDKELDWVARAVRRLLGK